MTGLEETVNFVSRYEVQGNKTGISAVLVCWY